MSLFTDIMGSQEGIVSAFAVAAVLGGVAAVIPSLPSNVANPAQDQKLRAEYTFQCLYGHIGAKTLESDGVGMMKMDVVDEGKLKDCITGLYQAQVAQEAATKPVAAIILGGIALSFGAMGAGFGIRRYREDQEFAARRKGAGQSLGVA